MKCLSPYNFIAKYLRANTSSFSDPPSLHDSGFRLKFQIKARFNKLAQFCLIIYRELNKLLSHLQFNNLAFFLKHKTHFYVYHNYNIS